MVGIKGEKQCELCGCMFVNKEQPNEKCCSSCAGKGPEKAGPNEKFIHQDIKRSDMDAKLTTIMLKLDTIIKLLKMEEKKPVEYSHKCDTCGQVFVDDSAATKYCPDCKAAKKS